MFAARCIGALRLTHRITHIDDERKNGPGDRGHFALVVMTMLDDDDLLGVTMMPPVIHVVMSVLDDHCFCRSERWQTKGKCGNGGNSQCDFLHA
jgi:hypothetical protein